MRTKLTYFLLGAVAVCIVYFVATWGKQPEKPNPVRRKSPTAIANIIHTPSNTYIKIVYGQPYKRGRQIFGELVPYGEIWRTGANEATELTTTNDILFAGRELEAGTYSLFSIPREKEPWVIILNSEPGQWGAFQYNAENDVFRVEVPAINADMVMEAFTIRFSGLDTNPTDIPVFKKDSTNIVLAWDKKKVVIPIKFR